MSEPTHYVNVDLDITSDEPLQPLRGAWADEMIATFPVYPCSGSTSS